MKCQSIKYILQDYFDGDVSIKIRNEISAHLKTCKTCQREYQELKKIRELAQDEAIPVPAPEDRYWDNAWQKIESQIAQQPNGIGIFERVWEWLRPQFQFTRLAYTTAIFCIGLMIGGYMFRSTGAIPVTAIKIKPNTGTPQKTVVQYLEVPKKVEKTKYRVRYVVLESSEDSNVPKKPVVSESAVTITAAATPESASPDELSRQQIQQVEQELQKQFEEHDVSKQVASILGQS
ncbi:MAG: anti-sigma factor [bacterium]